MPKILYVDDEADNIEFMTRRLTRRGFEVKGALAAADGLALAKEWKPDLILMDIKMPAMDGFEATSRLKADPETAAIPVIVLTANAIKEDEDRAMAAGANEYATKPVDLPLLLEKIGKLIPPTAG